MKFSLSDKLFTMAIRNTAGELVYFKALKNQIKRSASDFLDAIYHDDTILSLKFTQIEYVSFSKRWALVPAEFLPDGSEASYIDALFKLQEHELVNRDSIKYLQLHIVFGEERELRNQIHHLFPTCQITHISATLLRKTQHIEKKGYTAHIELYQDRFFYLIFKDDKLLICNQFSAEQADDVLYFVILTNHSLNISGRDLVITLGGYNIEKEGIEKNFKEHFPQIQPVHEASVPNLLKTTLPVWQEFHLMV